MTAKSDGVSMRISPSFPSPALLSLPRALVAEERSTVTVGFLMLSVALFLCVSAIWNTGMLVDRKIQAQAIADGVALSAASEMASSLNDMVTQNMLQVRLQSAHVIQLCNRWMKGFIGVQLAAAGAYTGVLLAQLRFISAAINGVRTAMDLIRFIKFCSAVSPAEYVSDIISDVKDKYGKLTPNLNQNINNSAKRIAEFVGNNGEFEIYVGSRHGFYYPQVTVGNDYLLEKPAYTTKLGVLALRTVLFDQQWKNVKSPGSLPDPYGATIPDIPTAVGKFLNTDFADGFKSKIAGSLTMATAVKVEWFVVLAPNIFGYATSSQWAAYVPKDEAVKSDSSGGNFQIVACVVAGNKTDWCQKNYMAPVFFKPLIPNNIIAVAAAEAVNPNYEFINEIPVISSIINFFPWRYWSSFGVNFQPRLTRVRSFAAMAQMAPGKCPGLAKALADNAGESGKTLYNNPSRSLFLH